VADRVLVTGGAGFIGLRLVRALLERGDAVTLIDDFSRGRRDPELNRLLGDVELIEHDLTRPLPSERLGGGFRSVFHLVAVVGTRASAERPHDVLRINLGSALNVLDWVAANRPERLFLSSTSEVTDGAVRVGLAAVPVGDDAPLVVPDIWQSRASYAVSKIASESLFLNLGRQSDVPVRIARYFNVYGPRMGHDHVIPQLIDRILDRRDPFAVYGAYQARSFCYVDDAVRATLELVELPDREPIIASVGNDVEEIEIVDLVSRLFALAGYSAELQIHEPPAGSPDRRRPDLSRVRQLIGFEPQVPLDEGLRRTYEWYRAERGERVEV
jgi:UDP-glucose 4-epimerase/UDP-glucuronate decarboxylase